MRKFKDSFYNLRTEGGYSQREIAKLLHTSPSTIAMWESGERQPTYAKREEIADFFNVDMEYLSGKSDLKRKVSFDENGNPTFYGPEGQIILSAFEKTAKEFGMLSDDEAKILEAYKHSDNLHKQMVREILGVK